MKDNSNGDAVRLRVGFVLARNFTLSAFASFVDVLRLAGDEGDRSRRRHCDWQVLSDSARPICSSCGTSVLPDKVDFQPGDFDYIIVIGGVMHEGGGDLSAWQERVLHLAAQKGVPLIGICTGVFALCRAGLMKGHKCCVSWFHHADFIERFDSISPIANQLFVVDRDRLTSSGGVGAAHLAAYLVNRHIGAAAAAKSLHILMIDRPLGESVPQPQTGMEMQVRDPFVRKALILIQQHMSVPMTTDAIAKRLGIGRRQLERRFRNAIGAGPARAGRIARLRHGERLVQMSGLTLIDAAVECGFCDGSHFARAFRAEFGRSPTSGASTDREIPDLQTEQQGRQKVTD
ncbi:MAG TPA: GlxA family transcriptional regulator [Hyphomonas sp.]|nr:GlxA family transcriptional regulator [Hyphomonas sp.]